jgi:hypothetical protein
MSRKDLPPPAGGDQLTAMLRRRHDPPAETRPATTPTPTKKPPKLKMDRRSWYMPKATADQLAAAVDELHYSTRQPKHVVLAALVAAAVAHQDEARARLEPGGSKNGTTPEAT